MSKPLLIVVEDDAELLRLFYDLIAVLDCAFIGVHRKPSADAIMLRDAPDLLITDMMLSGDESGIEYATRLRARGMTCPIVAMSASTQMLELTDASGLFAACVSKPFDITEMYSLITSLLGVTDDHTG